MTNHRLRFVVFGVVAVAILCLAAVWYRGSIYRPGSAGARSHAYAGSVTCQKCHEDEFADWAKSHHALAERDFGSNDFSAFRHPLFSSALPETKVFITNGQPKITTTGLGGSPETFTIERVIGESPLRQFLVPFPGGRMQALEAAYDPRSNQWFNVYGEENRRPGEWGHWTGRGMNWNSMCGTCHNTRFQKNYHEATDTFTTSMAEMSVGCEACHGPLQAHNDWQQKFGNSGKKDPTLLKLTRNQTLENCAFCHARRNDLTGDFKPGDNFSDNMKVAVVDNSDNFYADGQIRAEDYEYSAFLGSRMHAQGVTCTDCHNPHTVKPILPGNWLCLRCHAVGATNTLAGSLIVAPPINPVLHSHHKVFGFDSNGTATNLNLLSYDSSQIKESGGECINCHMPQTVYMQRHWRHDHGMTIPDPLLTKDDGIPNACNRCHQDKDADWALKACDEWYGDKMTRPPRRRAQIIAAAKRGDAGAFKGLIDVLAKDDIAYWRAVTAGLLEPWAKEPSVQDALVRALSDTNDLVRAASVEALEPSGGTLDEAVAMALQEKLADPIRNVRILAAWDLAGQADTNSPAWHDLEKMLEVNADQPPGQMQQGALALLQSDPSRALEHYRRAVEWDHGSAVATHDYAICLSRIGDNNHALEQMEAACRLEPKNGQFQYELALAYHAAGQDAKVIPTLQNAVRLDHGVSAAWYNLGLALNAEGQVDAALNALANAELLSSEARIPYARATILAQAGKIAEAREAAKKALDLEPGFQPARDLLRALQTGP